MPDLAAFDYAILRVVPRVERQEFVNAGVVMFCLERRFLCARTQMDAQRVLALWPSVDLALIRSHLQTIEQICAGDAAGGPIGRLSQRERFHWLVAPRSTVIQVSDVHSGLTADPESTLDRLMVELVQV